LASDPTHRPRSAEEFEQGLLMFCRPTYREHQIERISAQGFAPALTPAPMTKTSPNSMVPTPMAPPVQTKKSKTGLIIAIIALLAVGGGIAAAVVATQSPAVEPTPVATTPEPPKPIPTPPPEPPKPVVAPPVVPAKITLSFAITPATALIEVDGKRIDKELTVDKDTATHKLHITAKGFTAHDEDIHFDETERLRIDLDKVVPTTTTTKLPKEPNSHKPPDKIDTQSPY
jgi:hypothetical protein